MADLDQYKAAYREEAGELLAELESTLLELEESPEDGDLVAKAFRAMHTLKGSGSMFGFDEIAAFTHGLETAFDRVRAGHIPVTRELVGLALQAKDVIRALLEDEADDCTEAKAAISASLKALCEGGPAAVAAAPAPTPADAGDSSPPSAAPAPRTYRVQFLPASDLTCEGADPSALIDELKGLGRCEVILHEEEKAPGEDGSPGTRYSPWDAVLTTDRGPDAIRDVFLFVEGRCDVRVDLVDDGESTEEVDYKRLGEILVARGDLSAEDLGRALESRKRIGDLLEEQGLVQPSAIKAAAVEQAVVREARTKREATSSQASEAATSVRVSAEKLDDLVDLVGELVIAQARLSRIAAARDDTEVVSIAEELERLSASLRDSTLSIRMVPIGTTFSRFKRLVRDLSSDLGKQIDLVTEGEETELDKTVIERLGDPLVHLIRNSCDHGIETPSARVAAGKPPTGTVRLSAYHAGANVLVEVRDDGAGLDPEAIRTKAVERGLLTADARLSDKELFGLIFLPGFSTAKSVSNVSGRGVGMDVVKRSIDALRGAVEIESEKGLGTTIRVRLPLTLAIIEGLLVAVGPESYVMPLSLVEECVELSREEAEKVQGRRLAAVRGELVPYLRLREWFRIDGSAPAIEQIAIANLEGNRLGFVVDSVVGQHQTVIKSLGKMYRNVEGLSGSTILGDGSVALILDLPRLANAATAAV